MYSDSACSPPVYRLRVTNTVFERFPDYAALVLYISGLDNTYGGEGAEARLREAERSARTALSADALSSHPRIRPWRAAYATFGAKPSKYPCSAEALLKRVLKGDNLPSINPVVDSYNALSLSHCIPIGGEDWDQLASDLELCVSTGQEPFITRQQGELVTEHPEAGEIIWRDTAGVTCRRLNWRQCTRTAVTEETHNAYFVLDRLPPMSLEELYLIGAELIRMLRDICPGCNVQQELLCRNRTNTA